MIEPHRCPQCGSELPAGALPEDLCPRCLLQLGLTSETSFESKSGSEPLTTRLLLEKLPEAGQQFGQYRILQLLGEGGMGVVYLAEQEQPIRRRVALKLIKLGMDTREVVARFESERQALAMMDHPNIARVFEAGASAQGRPYFVMEYVQGTPITDYCDQQRLGNRARLGLFNQVCQAIQHAHQKGIIHRDIKPSNVLVSVQDGKPVPKVIDFGVAKATNQRLTEKTLFTQQGMLIGTPEYMSPEQAEMTGLDVDSRTDIYSLGVLLYVLLVGALPFDSKVLRQAGYDEVRRIIRKEDPPKPTTRLLGLGARATEVANRRKTDVGSLAKELRGDLDWITMKALEKNRTRRYATASELAADIGNYLHDEPIVAGPPSRSYRLKKLVRRNKGPFASLAGLLMVLLIGFGVSLGLYFRAERARGEAQKGHLEALRANYVVNIRAAETSLRIHETLEAKRRLTACDPGLRGLEWNYLYRACDATTVTLRGHSRPVTSVGFSLDGTRIVSGSEDRTVRVWNASSGQLLQTFDGDQNVRSVVVSPDGRFAASESTDGTIRVWNPSTGETVSTIKTLPMHGSFLAFSVEGSKLIWFGGSRSRIWDTVSGRLVSGESVSPDHFTCVAIGRDGRNLVLGHASSRGGIFLRSLHNKPRPQGFKILDHVGPVDSMVFSPDAKKVLQLAGSGNAIRVWDIKSGREASRLEGHLGPVRSLAFSPDGQRMVSGALDNTVRVWDVKSGRNTEVLVGHDSGVLSTAFDAGGNRIASGSQDKTVRIWDLPLKLAATEAFDHDLETTAVAFDLRRKHIIFGDAGGRMNILDVDSRTLVKSLPGHQGVVTSVAFHPSLRRIATASNDTKVQVWDSESGKILLTLVGHKGPITSIAFSSQGDHVVTGSEDQTVRVWKPRSEQSLVLSGHEGAVRSVAFSPNGEQVLSGGDDRTLCVWEARTGKHLMTLRGHDGPVNSVAFNPNGVQAISGGEDTTIRVWDLQLKREQAVLRGHDRAVTSVTYNGSGTRIISGSADRTVRVWDPVSGEPLITLRECVGRIASVAISPDDSQIVAVSPDSNPRIRVWATRSISE